MYNKVEVDNQKDQIKRKQYIREKARELLLGGPKNTVHKRRNKIKKISEIHGQQNT